MDTTTTKQEASKGGEHTAGPWTVEHTEQRGTGGERVFKVCSGPPYSGLIADVSAWWVDVDSARANARLIAAAPELLAALCDLLTLDIHGESAKRRCDNARAAIAKAEGRE